MMTTSSDLSLDQLPKEKGWRLGDFYKYDGFWYFPRHLEGLVAARSRFEARDDDVILVGSPKTGTTWLKALIPTVFSVSVPGLEDPLLANHPNHLVPSLEFQVYRDDDSSRTAIPDCPRLFRTHAPYEMLPESVRSGGCKIVYITRDPKDVVVSLHHFLNSKETAGEGEIHLDELFDSFCRGVHPFGPFHEHVLGYWNQALQAPNKILFLRYEELKRDPAEEVRKLASFLGRPLEKDEDVEKVLWRCSLERVKNLEVNASGVDPWVGMPYKSYFRRGVVGDWKNHLTPEMKERLTQITRNKMEGSGLNLEAS